MLKHYLILMCQILIGHGQEYETIFGWIVDIGIGC